MDTGKSGTILHRNPVIVFALIQSVVTLAVAFGLHLDAGQIGAILTTSNILLALIANTQVMPILTANAKIEEALNTEVPK